MSQSEFSSAPNPQVGSSRSAESRRAVFKILSDTLRPPPSNIDRQPWSMTQRPFPKINKTSPRGIGVSRAKSTFSSFYSPTNDDSTSRFSSLRDCQSKGKASNVKQIKNKLRIGGGLQGGEGNNGEHPHFQSQSSPTLPSSKNCHLSNVLRSAKRCLHELRRAKDNLSYIVADDDQLARGIKKSNPTENHLQLSQVALSITNLCREAFVPAHRLNQTAIALYNAEDFLRYPSDIRTFDLHSSSTGRIKLPDMTFNTATVMKLRQVVDLAADTYNKFNGRGRLGDELQEILFSILIGFQNYYASTLGCQEIFKVLLYTGPKDKAHLQQFLLALSSMDRSDLLVEIQDLRRILDEIVIFLEKMSWGSFLIYRLSGGENAGAVSSSAGEASKSNGGMPAYPAYPLLRAKGPPKKKKVVTEDDIEPCAGAKLSMKPAPIEPTFQNLQSIGSPNADLETGRGGKSKSKSKFSRKSNADIGDGDETLVGDSHLHYTKTQKKKSDASLNSIKTERQ